MRSAARFLLKMLGLALFCIAGVVAPAPVIAFHQAQVTVTITKVDNLGRCFDVLFLFTCSRPDYFAIIKFRGRSGREAECGRTGIIENRDHITPTDWTCTQTVDRPLPGEGPLDAIIEIWDFDGAGLNPFDLGPHDQADIVAGNDMAFTFDVEPFLAARFPSVPPGPASTSVTSRGDDTEAQLTITADAVRGNLSSVGVTPPSFDPSIGEEVRFSGTVNHDTKVRISISGPSGQLWSAAKDFPAGRFEFTWDGKDATGTIVSPGTYTITISGSDPLQREPLEPTIPPTRQEKVTVIKRPLNAMQLIALDPSNLWNPRSGPLNVRFSMGANGTAGLRLYPGSGCGPASPLRALPIQSVNAGQSTLSWDGRDNLNAFVLPGQYAIELFAFDVNGNPTSPSTFCRVITVIAAPPLELAAEHSPIVPLTGDTVTFTATALDANHKNRRTWTIEIWVANSQAVGTSVATTRPSMTCQRIETCQATLPNLAAAPGRIAYRVVAFDIDGPSVETPWRLVDVARDDLIGTARPIMAGVSSEPFGIVRQEKTLDIAFVAGSNYDLSASSGRTDFLFDAQDHIKQLWGIGGSRQPSVFLARQKNVSVWVSLTTVPITRQDRFKINSLCVFSLDGRVVGFPAYLASADVVAVIHRITCRDNAPGKTYSAKSPTVGWHEIHHAAFGLVDEYCCDGFYDEVHPHPTLYFWPNACTSDPLTDPTQGCAPIRPGGTIGAPTRWWRFDSDPDVMVNNSREQKGDVRRANWFFDQCDLGKC